MVGVVGGGVAVLVVVGVLEVVVVVVAGAVAVWVGAVGVVGVLVVWWQSFWASSATVEAPWIRLLRRVTFTVTGRLPAELPSAVAALETPAQLPAASAEDTWFS